MRVVRASLWGADAARLAFESLGSSIGELASHHLRPLKTAHDAVPRQLHLIRDLAPSGTATQLGLLAAAAVERGEAVTVATLRWPGAWGEWLTRRGVRVEWFGGRFQIDPFALRKALKLIAAEKSSVIQSWDAESAALARQAVRWALLPWIATLRGDGPHHVAGAKLVIAPDPESASGIDPAIVRVVPNTFAPHLTPSDPATKLDARRRLREAGYDVSDGAPVLACVLRIDDPAPAKELAWGADLVRVLNPGLRLLVVGDGPGRMAAERFADKAAERGTVLWLGWQEDLAAICAAADVVWVGRGGGAAPTPLLEAMAAGRAVVAADAPGRERLLPHDGALGSLRSLVRWDDRAGWAQVTKRLLDDKGLADRLGRENAERVRTTHSLADVAEAYAAAVGEAAGL